MPGGAGGLTRTPASCPGCEGALGTPWHTTPHPGRRGSYAPHRPPAAAAQASSLWAVGPLGLGRHSCHTPWCCGSLWPFTAPTRPSPETHHPPPASVLAPSLCPGPICVSLALCLPRPHAAGLSFPASFCLPLSLCCPLSLLPQCAQPWPASSLCSSSSPCPFIYMPSSGLGTSPCGRAGERGREGRSASSPGQA